MPCTRRHFMESVSAATGTLALAGASPPASDLPKVRLGKHEVTRLIVGANPFYGGSHFNRLFGQHMKEWMTPERVVEYLRRCELAGINTWQLHYSERSMSDLARHHAGGGKMQWILLTEGEMMKDPTAHIPRAARLKPIGIAHHGVWTDQRFRNGEMEKVREMCTMIRDSGAMVGISTHNPAVIDYIEGKNWDVDFYMACVYRVTRTIEEIRKELGEAPVGELYLEKDPERMYKVIRQMRKPCLAFKILAAGRATRTVKEVENAFRFAYENLKPKDCVIVGMYPRYDDQITENAAFARRFAAVHQGNAFGRPNEST